MVSPTRMRFGCGSLAISAARLDSSCQAVGGRVLRNALHSATRASESGSGRTPLSA